VLGPKGLVDISSIFLIAMEQVHCSFPYFPQSGSFTDTFSLGKEDEDIQAFEKNERQKGEKVKLAST